MGVDSLSVRVFWPSTVGAIQPGWTQDTAIVDRFLQGSDATYTGPANGGGSHDHDPDEHTHVGVPHDHDFSSATVAPAAATVDMEDVGSGLRRVPNDEPPVQHSHVSATSAAATITYQDADPAVTIDTTDALPPYRTMVVIKPDLVTEDVPDDAVCYTDETPTGDGLPTGFVKYAALNDRFIRGANAGGINGGDATHGHTSPGTHSHQDDFHVHVGANSGIATPTFVTRTGTPTSTGRPIVHHTVSLNIVTLSDVTDVAVTVNAASSEPSYIKLLGIQNTSGDPATPVGIIVAFVGDADDIPSNWQLCDGAGDTPDCTDRQIKATGTDGDVGDTGGSDEHTHTTATHNHVHGDGVHGHTANAVTILLRTGRDAGSTKRTVAGGVPHTHSWSVGSTLAGMQSTAVTMSTDDGRSAYRTVVYIKKMIERPGPKGLLASTF